ncbi:NAD-dependent epimerase/dehydratase family protein [Ulvibacterium sp.]|uniref:NAD-dependent epimerase/dehydratase family protein n=1 Tax=Ulvibacterium sp. TaxID=2665914 RepID=UPI003BAD0700
MVLVTGGTGMVGAHLLLHLLQKNIPIKAIYRPKSNLQRVKKVFSYYAKNGDKLFQQIKWIEADLNDIPALEGAFKGVEYVYHAAALITFDPGDYKKLFETNTKGTANIVNLCIEKGVKKLCYVSTIGAIGKSSKGAMATEENEWSDQEVNVYALTKYWAEMEVWRGSQEGLPIVILNPGVIIGPGFWDSGTGDLFTTANKGYKYYPPGGTGFISIHDVIHIMVALMESKIYNERFVTVAKNLTFKEILQQLAQALGKQKPTKELKLWQLEIGRWFDWLRNLFTGQGRRITKNAIQSLKHREFYNSEKLKNRLGFDFESLDETLEFCCARFKEENP